MKTAYNLACHCLAHVKTETVPAGALLPVPPAQVGIDPWEYLYGTTGNKVTAALLDERYRNFYAKKGWSREAYDLITKDWPARYVTATDCQGLLDSLLGTDVTAHYCYSAWCTEKGAIDETGSELVIGEAVFIQRDGRMAHIGFVCGYMPDGEPLIVEARGIRFGVVVTRLGERPWTHHGKPTKKLDFSEPIIIYEEAHMNNANTTPAVFKQGDRGDDVRALQHFLNAVCYRDAEGFELAEDTKLGPKTLYALKAFLQAHASLIAAEPAPPETHTYKVMRDDIEIAGWEG